MSGRLSRTVMLVIAVAMSAGLIAAVACVMASLTLAVEQRIKSTVGSAELRLRHVGSGSFDAGVLEQVRGWPEVASVTGRVREALALRRPTDPEGETNAVTCWGVDPATERDFRPATLVEGRYVQGPGEVVLDEAARRSVKAGVGERLIVERFGDPVELTVVGIVKPPPLGAIVEREECFMALAAMPAITGEQGRVTEADIQLRPQQNPESVAAARRGEGSLPPGVILQLTERVTSGLNKNMESNEVGFYLACVLSFMAAAFIITTGMTTSVTERTRELAILRSIGAERRQLAWAQMLVGLLVGSVGAAIGVPGGVGAAYLLVWLFPEQLPGGFAMSQGGVALAMVGAVLSGVFGAAWPAVAASRVSPLEGLSLRARPPAAVWVWVCLGAGCVLVAAQYLLMTTTNNRNLIFWGYVTAGLPMMMVGYFLLAVPVNRVVTALLSAPLSRALGLPRSMLARTVAATPFRHGFTAASMMLGLALMLSIWTNGRAIMNDWLESLALPDAFIYGHNLKADAVERVRKNVPEVLTTCAITVQNVDTDWAGGTGERQVRSPTTGGTLRGLGKYKTSFVGFEPEAFFSMTRLSWEAGTKEEAVRRLNAGGAVIVSREFAITHGFRLGDRVRVTLESKGHDFEVVGIVSSPGLDIVSKFLEVGEQYVDQSINAICGSREDLRTKFGNDAVS
ncbi:MAG: ABC transporter permease, partial [Phycisphaerales bacterium]